MMKSRMRTPRVAVLAAMLGMSVFAGAALADDARPEKSPTEKALEALVKGFYGTLDVSFDVASKGMSGFVAYPYGAATSFSQTVFTPGPAKNGGAGPVGKVGFQPEISTNKAAIGWRGSHSLPNTETKVLIQIEASIGVTAAPGVKTSQYAQSNTVTGTIGSGDTFIGLGGDWGAFKFGTTYAPYKKSTDRMNPFSGMLGDYAVVMGNTGGDNRVEFGTRLEHSLWYESPNYSGLSYDVLYSPGQNYTTNNVVQSSGSSNCNGGNVPGSGNLLLNCDDGGFGSAFSLDVKYETKQFYVTAAYEIHKDVNRNSDGIGSNNPYYGLDASTLDNAGFAALSAEFPWYAAAATPAFLNDIGDETAYKVGGQYIFETGTTVSAIWERMTRKLPANLNFQNERQRNGFWLAVTQDIDADSNVSFGWAHAGKTPGDPGGQHNYNPNATDNSANMFTLAYKHKVDKQFYWYVDAAETVNKTNAHYDIGAGGRGLTTDCHDGTNTPVIDYTSAGNTTWGGCKPKGISVGMNYKF